MRSNHHPFYLCLMARVLYLSYDGLTDPLGQSQILPYVAGLSARGHEFVLVSCEKPQNFARRKQAVQKICAEAGVEWHPLPYTKSPPVVSTLADLRRMKEKARALHGVKPFDFIHCRSYLPVLIALDFKKRHGVPYVFDMRGYWADERVEGGIWNLDNPVHHRVYRFFKTRERSFLEEAAAVVALTHASKRELRERFVTDPLFGGGELFYNYDSAMAVEAKTAVIPCAADTALFDPSPLSPARMRWLGAKYGLESDAEYLGYVGSLGTWYMGAEMVHCFAAMRRARPGLRFLILSHDDPEPWYRHAKECGVPASAFTHVSAERRDVPGLMRFMSASLFFILPVFSKTASSPTKQGELMAMGVPVICNAGVGDTAEIVERYRAGVVVRGFSEEDFVGVASRWEELLTLDKTRIREGAREYYDLNRGLDAYEEVYAGITEGVHASTPTEAYSTQ